MNSIAFDFNLPPFNREGSHYSFKKMISMCLILLFQAPWHFGVAPAREQAARQLTIISPFYCNFNCFLILPIKRFHNPTGLVFYKTLAMYFSAFFVFVRRKTNFSVSTKKD